MNINMRVQKNGMFNKLGRKQFVEQLEYKNNQIDKIDKNRNNNQNYLIEYHKAKQQSQSGFFNNNNDNNNKSNRNIKMNTNSLLL